MKKNIKLKNSTILLIGICIITIGASIGLYDYFLERKNRAFSEMNIKLYESELPENIENEEELENRLEEENNNSNQEDKDGLNDNKDKEPNKVVYNYAGILEIPKINLKRGFFDLDSKYNKVSKSVTVINGSTFPDVENNNLILAAHSGNCSICYFDKLYKLSVGDLAYIKYKNIKYTYKIVNIYYVKKDGKVAIYRDNNKGTLTLITCTRNSDTKQTVYILELID